VTVRFGPGETSRRVLFPVVDDSLPEGDELFQIILTSPTGGAVLGEDNSVTITIRSNDDAHGIISFTEVG